MVVSNQLKSLWLRLKFSPKVRQLLAGGGASHGAIAIGTVIGWFPHALETLLVDPAFAPISREKIGWMMLLVVLGALAALIPAAYSSAKFGRIWTMRFFCLTLLGGWILVAAANSVDMILAGRFLLGVSCGGFAIVTPLYMIEVAEVELRGMLGFMYTQQIYIGVVMALFTARHDAWKILTLQMAPIAIITFIFSLFIPDTPIWHLKQGNTQLAHESMRWLRGAAAADSDVVQEEVGHLQDLLDIGTTERGVQSLTFTSMFTRAPYKHMVGIAVALLCIQPALSISPVQFYTLWINIIAGDSSRLKPTSVALAVTGVTLLGMGIMGHFSGKVSRKKLLITSCMLMVIAFGVLGAMYYLDGASERMYWPIFTAWCVLFFVYALGFMALPNLLLVEATHPRFVEAVLCLATGFQWLNVLSLCFFLGLLITNPSFGIGPTFWGSAVLCLIAALLAYYYVPETTGKTLGEIQGVDSGAGAGSRPSSQQNMVDVSTMRMGGLA